MRSLSPGRRSRRLGHRDRPQRSRVGVESSCPSPIGNGGVGPVAWFDGAVPGEAFSTSFKDLAPRAESVPEVAVPEPGFPNISLIHRAESTPGGAANAAGGLRLRLAPIGKDRRAAPDTAQFLAREALIPSGSIRLPLRHEAEMVNETLPNPAVSWLFCNRHGG